ncbi:MAG TPA: LysR family transcriptional regulator [Streptosporangiaceae bacterium]|jgi:DNA-binding transcriptional LysR family regulator
MTVGGMDLNLLIALRAMLEESNVTRAGERIGMAQPAMSAALARLRRHYRDDLLVRVGRDYELTPFARSLLPVIQQTMPMVEVALALRDEFDPATSARTFSITLSDYAFTVLNAPLVQRLAQVAPGVRLEMTPIPWDMHVSDRGLLQCDFLVGPLGCGLPGKSAVLFRDRFVCVADPANERLAGGTLTLRDFEESPHAVATFGPNLTPLDRALSAAGISRNVSVTTVGWLSLPFVVAGTDLVASLPERLARQASDLASVTIVEPPFGTVEIIEALWWHPTRDSDAGHRWLLGILRGLAEDIVAGGAGGMTGPGETSRPAGRACQAFTTAISAPG